MAPRGGAMFAFATAAAALAVAGTLVGVYAVYRRRRRDPFGADDNEEEPPSQQALPHHRNALGEGRVNPVVISADSRKVGERNNYAKAGVEGGGLTLDSKSLPCTTEEQGEEATLLPAFPVVVTEYDNADIDDAMLKPDVDAITKQAASVALPPTPKTPVKDASSRGIDSSLSTLSPPGTESLSLPARKQSAGAESQDSIFLDNADIDDAVFGFSESPPLPIISPQVQAAIAEAEAAAEVEVAAEESARMAGVGAASPATDKSADETRGADQVDKKKKRKKKRKKKTNDASLKSGADDATDGGGSTKPKKRRISRVDMLYNVLHSGEWEVDSDLEMDPEEKKAQAERRRLRKKKKKQLRYASQAISSIAEESEDVKDLSQPPLVVKYSPPPEIDTSNLVGSSLSLPATPMIQQREVRSASAESRRAQQRPDSAAVRRPVVRFASLDEED